MAPNRGDIKARAFTTQSCVARASGRFPVGIDAPATRIRPSATDGSSRRQKTAPENRSRPIHKKNVPRKEGVIY